MGKYTPLRDFLTRQRAGEVSMTFREIEHVLGFPLPPSQKHRAWWSNNASNNVMTQAWLDAGFETEQVDVDQRRLVFRRARQLPVAKRPSPKSAAVSSTGKAPRASFIGWMKGTITVAPGVDLTEPADPEWGRLVEEA